MVELLTMNEMANIIFLAIQNYKNGENKIVTDIIHLSLSKITERKIKCDTQDIYDTICGCFNLYNSFIDEKNMPLPKIEDTAYAMIYNILNSIVTEMR